MSDFNWVPSRGFQKTTQPTVFMARFGEGYSQRMAPELNNNKQSWSLNFIVDVTDANSIISFLETKKGVTAFTWTPPGETEIKVICQTWNMIYTSHFSRTIDATFERVYE